MMRILDRIAQMGMLIGVALMLNPWWEEGLRCGFFATALCTILHIYTSHKELDRR
jgi:hypothetical protein